MSATLYPLARLLCWVAFHGYFRLEITGRRNIPRRGAFIVAANHMSFLDPPIVGYACPRTVHFFARRSLFDNFLLGLMIRSVGAVPLDRAGSSLTLRTGLRILAAGQGLAIFPEGTRRAGSIGAGKGGVGFLAVRAKCPVVPARVVGTEQTLSPGSPRVSPARFRIIFGAPVRFTDRDYEAVTEQVMRLIRELA